MKIIRFYLAGSMIIGGITGIISPQKLIERTKKNKIINGEPSINKEEMPKYIEVARNVSLFFLIIGIIILATNAINLSRK